MENIKYIGVMGLINEFTIGLRKSRHISKMGLR
jgi:hypothetical protein